MHAFQSPAEATYWFISGRVLFSIITLLGVACFAYIVARRLTPMLRAERDIRFDRPLLPIQILWLELFIDLAASVAFEREPPPRGHNPNGNLWRRPCPVNGRSPSL